MSTTSSGIVFLLAIETATDVCSAAVADESGLLGVTSLFRPRSHAEHLVPMIQDLVARCGLRFTDVSAVAVSAGPGSYTGLRIGVSTAKGLAFSTGAAMVAVPTLEAFAHRIVTLVAPGEMVLPVLDARRSQVYSAAFVRTTSGLDPIEPSGTRSIEEVSGWIAEAGSPVHVLGDGPTLLSFPANSDLELRCHASVQPSADTVAHLGIRAFTAGDIVETASLEPMYLREFVAKTPTRSAFEKLGF